MDQPTVCAVMLTRDRPELAKRAVECFRTQTYPEDSRALLIWDNGIPPDEYPEHEQANVLTHIAGMGERDIPIGALRNSAVDYAVMMAHPAFDIFVHWDDDDFSHPNRITEQVALLQASGADVVGYNEMLFWREMRPCDCEVGKFGAHYRHCTGGPAQAWLYSYSIPKPTLGTSLMYWRKTWEQRPFNPKLPNNSESMGEDWDFIRGRKVAALSSLTSARGADFDGQPRMIARIHGSNTTKYNLDASSAPTWKRVPEWDARVRELLK